VGKVFAKPEIWHGGPVPGGTTMPWWHGHSMPMVRPCHTLFFSIEAVF